MWKWFKNMMARNDSSQMKECLSHSDKQDECKERSRKTSENGSSPKRRHSGSSSTTSTNVKQSLETNPIEPYPLEKMKKKPECHMQLDELHGTHLHTVLIDIKKFHDGENVSHKAEHRWDNNHVKLPVVNKYSSTASRWQEIVKSLKALEQDGASLGDVEEAIMKYNRAYAGKWKFDALQEYVMTAETLEKGHFSKVISKLAKLALKLPELIQCPIPLLRKNHSHAVTMSQEQIASLLANAFFCTFPHRNTSKPDSEYANFPSINFSSLFIDADIRKTQKLRALFHYFHTVTEKDTKLDGLVTFERICMKSDEFPKWQNQKETLTNLHVSSEGLIEEEGKGMLQVDFANKFVGGGVLGRGLVQEEIKFLQCPELIVARLFTEKLEDNECLKITGARVYSKTSGYSDSFEWDMPYFDVPKRDEWKRHYCEIVAIDAMHFCNPLEQFTEKNINRELNKAYVGFMPDRNTPKEYIPAIATGNWGCGAFNGDLKLKALLQIMVAAVVQRDLAYFTFKEKELAEELQEMHHMLRNRRVTVGKLYGMLTDYCKHINRSKQKDKNVFQYIRDKLGSCSSHL